MQNALYGDGGFYQRERPNRHFRTSVHASPAFAHALALVACQVDDALGHPPVMDLVDIGSGDGLLAIGVLGAVPPDLAARLRVTAVDLSSRPPGLDDRIAWTSTPPAEIAGLVVANEWLDNVPLDVAEQTPSGPRLVLVDPATGDERLGPVPDPADLAWLERWWPMCSAGASGRAGHRAEIGRPRDEAWASVMVRLTRGTAIAVDYSHHVDNRPPQGTLTGYRAGSIVPAVPDGSCDITAHVALDAVADAGERAAGGTGTVTTRLTTQREALRALGMRGVRPALALAHDDPRGYLRALSRASEEAELIDPSGLGGFGWLSQSVSAGRPEPRPRR
ncbi:SAM-dependent methyltransferase [Planotetraspora thailandica]|nr:SAM-dependent methyltransferase [Planotetraspora thailandica]